jgi:HEAT repeat protein
VKWRRWVLVCALILVGVVIFGFVSNYRSEPRYKGRSLSGWLRVHEQANKSKILQAEEAIRDIGTNAITILLADLAEEPRVWMVPVPVRVRFPKAIQSLLDRLERTEDRRSRALWGFHILGPAAAPAVPALIRGLSSNAWAYTHPYGYGPCPQAEALTEIGRPAVPALIQTLTNRSNEFGPRGQAVHALGYMGTDANDAAEVLLGCVTERLPFSAEALWAAGNVAVDAKIVLPALTSALRSEKPDLRSAAIFVCRDIAERLDPGVSVSLVRPGLTDEDANVREAATNALTKLLPDEFPGLQ